MLLWTVAMVAQTDRQHIRQGNKLYSLQDYAKAEVEYRKALSKNQGNAQAMYNLGCALLRQERDSAAVTWFEKAAQAEKTPMRRSKAYHNLGCICQSKAMYAEAVEAYKSSLRLNPSDDETRYNLALCKRLQKNSPNGGKNNKDDKKDKNNKDDKQNKNKEKDQKDKDKQNQDKQQKQQPKDQMSKENAEQLLNAAMQEEKATQQRLKKSLQQPQRQKLEKNW